MPLAFPPFGVKVPEAGGALTIAASTWRWDGVSGSVRVSSGFPLRPTQVTAANLSQVRVYVGGVEQAVALQPLYGTFPDGSYRSVGIQFLYTLTHDTPVAAEVKINQGVRGTVDIAWVEPTKYGANSVDTRAVIAPTDPVHLCGTFVTLTPLTPSVNDTGASAPWSAKVESAWTGQATTGLNQGTAIYDHPHGLFATYCRTGQRTYYQWAWDWAIVSRDDLNSPIYTSAIPYAGGASARVASAFLDYALPATPGNVTCVGNAIYNPEAIDGFNDCGAPIESFSMRWITYSSCYWMTGWRQFRRIIQKNVGNWGGKANGGYAVVTGDTGWVDLIYGMRFNLGVRYVNTSIVAYLMECTTGFAQNGVVDFTYNYTTWLDWMLDAYELYEWNPGDYRDGIVGHRDTYATPSILPGNGDIYGITNFQLMPVAEYLMMYYDNVAPDARIPVWLTTMADYLITQIRPAISGVDPHYPAGEGAVRWVMPYSNTLPAMVADSTFTATIAAKGTAVGATTNAAGYAGGATSVTLAATGTGSILRGDAITFAGSAQVYRVMTGVANVAVGGTITFTKDTTLGDSGSPPGSLVGLVTAIPTAATAITVTGTLLMTYTGGSINCHELNLVGVPLTGTGLPPITASLHPVQVIGTAIYLNAIATGTATGATYSLGWTAWYFAMFPSLFAWVYAYTGNSTYKTWADRAAFPGNVASLGNFQTKHWGEHFGGTRQNYFYYTNGGTVRGTPGVHPTAITEPPDHPTLD